MANSNEYMRNYLKERWKVRRNEAILQLGSKCVICGAIDDLQFDHINPSTKITTIGKMSTASEKKFQLELSKCQLLCSTHHKLKSKLNGETGGGHNRIDNYDHGNWHMYTKQKCRCIRCSQWKKDYRAKLVDSMGRARP